MKTALVIMAAGIGSRFGGGIKQLEPVGPNGEIIMDYSIHDAVEAGFDKIVFIIRKDIEEDFREVIGNRMEELCKAKGVEITGQAVLACKDIVKEPFAVINADDYYGKEAFSKIHDFLQEYTPDRANVFCMAGFILKNTLSENGGVTRGVCKVDSDGFLTGVDETSNIVKTAEGAAIEEDGNLLPIDEMSNVSMNMWGLTPEFISMLEEGFSVFFENMEGNEEKAECLLPIYIDELLQEDLVSVKVLETADRWFGVTYKEDKPVVVDSFRKLIEDGIYQADLFADWKK